MDSEEQIMTNDWTIVEELLVVGAELQRERNQRRLLPVEPLTYEQRMIALSDGVPTKPDPRLYTPEEYAAKLAEYERQIGYKLSPIGNYVYTGPRTEYPELSYRSSEELRSDSEYGILRRIADAQK